MNWQQINSAADQNENSEITRLILQRLQARQEQLIAIPHKLIRNRRRWPQFHWVNDRRRSMPSPFPISMGAGAFVLLLALNYIVPETFVVGMYLVQAVTLMLVIWYAGKRAKELQATYPLLMLASIAFWTSMTPVVIVKSDLPAVVTVAITYGFAISVSLSLYAIARMIAPVLSRRAA